jgi:prepilin-type N-terminal cleavage/methylation domain-containing protein
MKQKGYTVVELLIVTTILVGLLTVVTGAGFLAHHLLRN